MGCYSPLHGFRSKDRNPNTGKRSIVFSRREGLVDLPLQTPCGQCIGCRLDTSRHWAVRIMNEASMYETNSFITLTYEDKYVPRDSSLQKHHLQKFFKKLRFAHTGDLIRYYACGEYGEKYARPHYHACVFNYDFPDKYHWKTENGFDLCRSPELEKLWPLGQSLIGDLTFESAAYVARYVTKKVTGKSAYQHYNLIDPLTGEVLDERTPEFALMSRRPGIGRSWYEKYKRDVFPDDFSLLRKDDKIIKCSPPRYYRNLLETQDPTLALSLKMRRQTAAENNVDNEWPRLKVREEVQILKFEKLLRSFENGQT